MNHDKKMTYDPIQNRWIVWLNGRPNGLHCGEAFELIIGPNKIPCRLELDDQWYIMIQEVRLNLRTHDTYRINI